MAGHVNPRLAAITELGTSVWLDQLRRSLVEGGELERMVREDCLRGVTSNPAIFEQAILGSDDYDQELAELAREGLDRREVYRRMAVRDVQAACDVLRPVHDELGGADGFVSLEVAPRLAHDTEGTIEQAHLYAQLVDRPNLMIKVPATPEGIPAIEQLLYEGQHVNVTLLFAVDAYREVMDAHLRALERRHAEGRHLAVHSVASFFVSRVDTEVDRRLAALGREELCGRAGLANARAAYRAFREVFDGPRFAALRAEGAFVQRPLWASTGVKNPRYPDTLYVEGLLGPDCVNTMPLATLLAAADHADVAGATVTHDPQPDLEALAEAGIDLADVTEQLLQAGIDAFLTPMERLLDGIDRRREAVVTGRPAAIATDLPDALERAVAARARRAQDEGVVRRIWAKDPSVWGSGPEIADRLGWLSVIEPMLEGADDLEAFAQEVRADGVTDVVVLGMGGSSLAPEVLRQSFEPVDGFPALHVLDSTDAGAVAQVERAITLERTLFVVSSKSGGTIEPMSLLAHVWERTHGNGAQFVAVTDPGTSLAVLAAERSFRRCFVNDPDIGGRYSALSYFGLVPAALAGLPVRALLERAQVAATACAQLDPDGENPGAWLGYALGEAALAGRDKLTFVVDAPIGSFGLWAEQLVAESTGKQGRGILPIADEPPGAPDAYGDDRIVVHLRGPGGEHDDAVRAIEAGGTPVLTIGFEDAADLGRLFFTAEFATAVAGWVLEINPFDQPDVQAAKDATARVLARVEQDGELPEVDDGDPAALLDGLGPGGYLAVLGYLAPSEQVDAAVAELRRAVRDRTRAATTFGYGPRYLHSTGQLHKGGPPSGRFLVLVHDAPGTTIPVPGAPYDLTTLKNAQAAGDLETLRAAGLPAARVRLQGDDPAAAIRELLTRLEGTA